MTISGIGSADQVQANTGLDPTSRQAQMDQILGPVAQLFGESTEQLESDLQSGKTSLSQLAQSKGISQTDLISAIQQGLQQSQPADGSAPLSSTQLTNFANAIANRVHGGGHHHHHGAGGASGAGATQPASSSNPLTAVEQDIQQLLQDLGTALSSADPTASGNSVNQQL